MTINDTERDVIRKMRREDNRRESDDKGHTVDGQYSRKVLLYFLRTECAARRCLIFKTPMSLSISLFLFRCRNFAERLVVRRHFSSLEPCRLSKFTLAGPHDETNHNGRQTAILQYHFALSRPSKGIHLI